MKAKLTGMGSYQGSPTADSSITITYSERLEDGAGNASVSQYVGKLDTGSRSWRDAHTGGDLLLPVTLSNTVRVEVTEVFRYTNRADVRTTFTGWATPTNMDGTELDYTQMRPPRAPSGAEPLTMQAARDLLARGNTQLQQTAQATSELRSVAGVRSLGRAPQAGDPAGLYRWVDGAGHEVDIAWDGNAETGRTAVLVTQAEFDGALADRLRGQWRPMVFLDSARGEHPDGEWVRLAETGVWLSGPGMLYASVQLAPNVHLAQNSQMEIRYEVWKDGAELPAQKVPASLTARANYGILPPCTWTFDVGSAGLYTVITMIRSVSSNGFAIYSNGVSGFVQSIPR